MSNESGKIVVKTSLLSMLSNLLLAVLKVVVGVLGNSYALIADSIESITDFFSTLLVYFGAKYSTKPADEDHPYGHGKADALMTFVVVLFLVVSAGLIAYNSILNFYKEIEKPESYTIYVLIGIIAIKEFMFQLVKKKAEKTKSSALMADAWHHRSDAITSVLALVGVICSIFLDGIFLFADSFAALLASGFIIYNAYKIFRPALGEVMDENQYPHLVNDIESLSQKIEGIESIEKCYVRKAGIHFYVDLHMRVNGSLTVKEGHDTSHQYKDLIKSNHREITDVLIHIEPS